MAAARSQGFDATARAWCDALLDGYVQEGGSQAVEATPAYVSRTFLEVLFYRLVVRPVADGSFAAQWLDECDAWLDQCPQAVT
jgi:hypothetical protein